MSYPPAPPVYPLLGNRWITPRKPSGGAADNTNIHMQLYVSPQAMQFLYNGVSYEVTTLIKTPPFAFTFNRGDIIMPDNTSALYYYVVHKEYYYKGFVSAFEGLTVLQCDANGTVPRTY